MIIFINQIFKIKTMLPQTNTITRGSYNAFKKAIKIPLIVGGGIRTVPQIQSAYSAGADMVVMGTAYEKAGDADLAISQYKKALEINPDYPLASQRILQLEKKK